MKKKILTITVVLLGIILLDSLQALVFNNNPIIKFKEYYDGSNLNHIGKGILVDTYNCTNDKKDSVIKGFSYSCSREEIEISLEDVNTKIQEYFGKENVDRTNLGYNYVDEKKDVVVVGLIDNSDSKQDEFIYNVFSKCCGSKYIKYIKEHSVIEFRKTDKITTSNNS